jgi:hypothetical protein
MVGVGLGTPEHRAATGVDADLERRAEVGGHQVAGADNQLAIPVCRARPRGRASGSGVVADIVRPDGLAGLGVDGPELATPVRKVGDPVDYGRRCRDITGGGEYPCGLQIANVASVDCVLGRGATRVVIVLPRAAPVRLYRDARAADGQHVAGVRASSTAFVASEVPMGPVRMGTSNCARAIVTPPTHAASSAGIASFLTIRSITISSFRSIR